ncbi:unnamed protein product, partial [marine sediment metagenome]
LQIIKDDSIYFKINDNNQMTITPATTSIFSDLVAVYGNLQVNENIYMTDENYIGISAAERIIFDTAGDISFIGANVGIGTESPGELLEVYGATKNIEISNTDETEAGLILTDAQGPTTQYAKILFNSGTNELDFLVNSATPKMTILSGGNVGIGGTVTAPSFVGPLTGTASKATQAYSCNADYTCETYNLAVSGSGGIAMSPTFSEGAIADTFEQVVITYKNYISFAPGGGSNDPGYIMHETAGYPEDNEGVLHLCPSDDNEYGDYVSIHGTNDPDSLKLHTDGT